MTVTTRRRSSAWAHAIAGRHQRTVVPAGVPKMALIAVRPGVSRWTYISLSVHPQFHLTARAGAPGAPAAPPERARISLQAIARRAGMRPAIARREGHRPMPQMDRRARPAGTAPARSRRIEVVSAETLRATRQIAKSHRRVDEPRGLRPSTWRAKTVRAPDEELAPAPRFARRSDPALAAPNPVAHRPVMVLAAPRPPTPERPSSAPAREPRQTIPAPAAAELDLQSLTDQVVRQIDRRIIAHRERLGRM